MCTFSAVSRVGRVVLGKRSSLVGLKTRARAQAIYTEESKMYNSLTGKYFADSVKFRMCLVPLYNRDLQ